MPNSSKLICNAAKGLFIAAAFSLVGLEILQNIKSSRDDDAAKGALKAIVQKIDERRCSPDALVDYDRRFQNRPPLFSFQKLTSLWPWNSSVSSQKMEIQTDLDDGVRIIMGIEVDDDGNKIAAQTHSIPYIPTKPAFALTPGARVDYSCLSGLDVQ
jgi:hypothetical protein